MTFDKFWISLSLERRSMLATIFTTGLHPREAKTFMRDLPANIVWAESVCYVRHLPDTGDPHDMMVQFGSALSHSFGRRDQFKERSDCEFVKTCLALLALDVERVND